MRALGMCFRCHDKWTQGHKCAKGLHTLEEEDADVAQSPETLEVSPSADTTIASELMEDQLVALSSLTGGCPHKTLKYKGVMGSIPICVLIDTSATSSFINPTLVSKLQLPTIPKPVKLYMSASGAKLLIDKLCPKVHFSLQNYPFVAELKVLDIPGYDVVLGCDWIASLGDVKLNLMKGIMMVVVGGNLVTLNTEKVHAEVLTKDSDINVKKEVQKGSQLFLAQLFQLEELSPASALPIAPILLDVITQFPQVFITPVGLPPPRAIDHQITLHPGSKPVNLRPYRFSYFQKLEIDKITQELLQQSWIQLSVSPFSSPVLLVKKKDGTWRMVVDYRKLNKATVKNKFPIPLIDDFLDELEGMQYFSKLDLRSGYHQIRMAQADTHKTAFQTHEGLFEFLVMPFGLTNAPATFQALMNSVFRPYLRKFVIVFFDDILVYSSTLEAHRDHLFPVLQTLAANQLYVKESKCSFGVTEVEYLGHIISKEGVATDTTKVEAMLNWPTPSTVKALRGFLGLTGYYRKFVRDYGIIARPLTDLLKKNNFKWNALAQQSFEQLKKAMSEAPVLKLPNFNQPFVVETDASSEGIGVVLMQDTCPIAFLSKKLRIKNQALSTYEKELLAIYTAVTKWRHYLLGREFIIKTDQISLKYLLEQKVHTPMQHKGLSKLLGLTYKIEYKKGVDNRVADALSRREGQNGPPVSPAPHFMAVTKLLPQWVTDIKASYEDDNWIKGLKDKLHLTAVSDPPSSLSEHSSVLRYKGRICVGSAGPWRHQILHELHDSTVGGHSGITTTYHRVKKHFY